MKAEQPSGVARLVQEYDRAACTFSKISKEAEHAGSDSGAAAGQGLP
jgi:hypothetical protein